MDDDDKLNSEDRKTRLRGMQRHARPRKGTPAYKQREDLFQRIWNSPAQRAKIKEMHQKAEASIRAQQESGAGYSSDIALRELQIEYNQRLRRHGSTYFPTSYDIAEAFFWNSKAFAGLLLLPETDYLISLTDFLDYITSPDAPPVNLDAAASVEPGQIINVNSLDTPGTLLLGADDGHSFSILGASYVRRGDELSMLMVVGEQFPHDELQELKDRATEPYLPMPHKPDMPKLNTQDSRVVFVDAEKHLVRDLVLCRFNLKTKQLDARCLMRDMYNRYAVLTDIAETLVLRDSEAMAERMGAQLDKASVIWEAAKTLLLLPSYLAARITVQRVEQRTTKLGLQLQNSLKAKRAMAPALPEAKVLFRRISAVRVANPSAPQQLAGRSYTPPLFQVQVSGGWRVFANPDQQGHDADGNSVLGRTWVRSHVRHKDKSTTPGPKVVYIKSSLSLARRKLEQYRERMAHSPSQSEVPRPLVPAVTTSDDAVMAGAYVYVMRCPAHGRDIYKVGYTDRDPEQRARELSGRTAAPTPFLVVQAWAVTEGHQAEQAGHQALEAYRLDSSREFFQAGYSTLRSALESAIQPWVL
ncbi:MAG: GIY-YIG nuclease family protein [Thiobacillaceae bacterium]